MLHIIFLPLTTKLKFTSHVAEAGNKQIKIKNLHQRSPKLKLYR